MPHSWKHMSCRTWKGRGQNVEVGGEAEAGAVIKQTNTQLYVKYKVGMGGKAITLNTHRA